VNDDELRRVLSGLRIPSVSDAARARARHRSVLALGRTEAEPTVKPSELLWKWTAGALALALAFVLAWQFFSRPPVLRENIVADQKFLQQLQALFPRQVNAVVEDNGKVDLSVAQSPEVGSDQPIVILFRRQGQLIRVLSYSGHEFSLPLDGHEHRFEILATASGAVIIEEDNKAWLAASKPEIAGYSVRAQTLEASL
jgi:hypothetical protein